MKPVRTQVGHSTPSLSNLSSILPRTLKRMEVGPVMLGDAPNFVRKMKRIGQTFSDVYNYMRRHKLKFGYGPKYLSLEVVVRPAEPGTVSNSYHKTLKTGTDTQTYLNKLPVVNPTPNENKTNTFKVKQLTPIQNEVRELTPIQNKVRELTPIQNEVTKLTPMQIKVTEQTPLYTGDPEGPERPPTATSNEAPELILKSPNADTVPITKSHISDTAPNSHKSLTADTDLITNYNPINGLSKYKPKTLPLAHKSNQSLISDTDYSKIHHIKPMYFTVRKHASIEQYFPVQDRFAFC